MLLGFKKQFVEPILNGTKIHSIRTDKNDRWKRQRIIHMATGVRTKNYNCFKAIPCVSTQRVFMTYAYNDLIQISVGARELFDYNERLQFALNDGFKNWQEFFDWFYPLIMEHPDQCYSGKIIHWTDKRY